MQYQTNYELHEFDELSENFAAMAANEYELLCCTRKDANRVLLIRENSDACVPNSENTFVSLTSLNLRFRVIRS